MKKKIMAFIFALMFVLTGTACGKYVEQFDPNKTQIFVKVFNGGGGTTWIEQVRDQFNANDEDYEIILRYEKIGASSIISEIQLGNPTADVYFTSDIAFQSGIYLDYFENLLDVLDYKVDGEENETIGEKMTERDNWVKMASKYGQGCYILPYLDAIMGMVYDHGLFLENGWLNYADETDMTAITAQGISFSEEVIKGKNRLVFTDSTAKCDYKAGDIILKAGKDGLYGTYDDGQPVTKSEFDAMMLKITNGNSPAYTFVYNAEHDNYLNHIGYAVMAQYDGYETFNNLCKYDSNGNQLTMHDGTKEAITIDNAYKQFQAECIYQGLSFMDEYFNSGDIYEKSTDITNFTHTDAQTDFILGYDNKENGAKYSAILVEGSWWENEARTMFDNITGSGRPEYGFGKRDFRYMLLPSLDNEKGAFGNGKGSVFSASDTGGIVVRKQSDANKLSKIKEFLGITFSNEVLVNFTKTTGIMRPFNYTLTDSDLETMTPFARNVYKIYTDKDNVKIVRPDVLIKAQPISFASSISDVFIPLSEVKNFASHNWIRVLRNDSSVEYSMSNMLYTTQDSWTKLVNQARAQGFYAQ